MGRHILTLFPFSTSTTFIWLCHGIVLRSPLDCSFNWPCCTRKVSYLWYFFSKWQDLHPKASTLLIAHSFFVGLRPIDWERNTICCYQSLFRLVNTKLRWAFRSGRRWAAWKAEEKTRRYNRSPQRRFCRNTSRVRLLCGGNNVTVLLKLWKNWPQALCGMISNIPKQEDRLGVIQNVKDEVCTHSRTSNFQARTWRCEYKPPPYV